MIVVVIGSIGAGKTTLTKRMALEMGFIRIGADDIRLQMTGSPTSWSPVVWSELRRRVLLAVADDRDVVVDATGSASRFPSLIAALSPDLIVRLESDWRTWADREKRRGRNGVSYKDWRYSLTGSRRVRAGLVVDTTRISPSAVYMTVADRISHTP